MKNWMYLIGFLIGCAVVAVAMPWIRRTCSPTVPAATALVSAVVTSTASVPAAVPSAPAGTTVQDTDEDRTPLALIPVDATYGREVPSGVNAYNACARVRTRVVGHSGNLPYPYQLTVEGTDNVDCGFFEAVHADGWRTAFCLNAAKTAREPQKLYIYDEGGDNIFIVVGLQRLGTFVKAACP